MPEYSVLGSHVSLLCLRVHNHTVLCADGIPLGLALLNLWVKEAWQRLEIFTPSGNRYSASETRESAARTHRIHRQLSPSTAAMIDQHTYNSKQCFFSSGILSSRHLRSLCATEKRKHVSQLTTLTAKHHCLRGTGR